MCCGGLWGEVVNTLGYLDVMVCVYSNTFEIYPMIIHSSRQVMNAGVAYNRHHEMTSKQTERPDKNLLMAWYQQRLWNA